MKKLFLLLLPVVLLCISCASGKLVAAKSTSVEYVLGRNYFSIGEVSKPTLFVMKSQKEFDAHFSPAATMGYGGAPTSIDFTKNIVIGMDFPLAARYTEVSPVHLSAKSGKVLELTYRQKVGQKQIFTMHPCFFIVVDKRYSHYEIVAKK